VNVRVFALPLVVPAALAAAGCGGSGKTVSSATTTRTSPTTTQQAPAATATSPGALQAEAASAATGDIPDNQVFLVFHSPGGWAMKYPEGWAQSGTSKATTFRDKNNIVRVVIQRGALPGAAKVRSDPSLLGASISSAPKTMTVSGQPAVKVVYTTRSAPNPVTGKRVTLTVDRYYLAKGRHLATVDLGTPVGVDNVDAYRLMIESFRWR
jgi:beta-galactosidase GanA